MNIRYCCHITCLRIITITVETGCNIRTLQTVCKVSLYFPACPGGFQNKPEIGQVSFITKSKTGEKQPVSLPFSFLCLKASKTRNNGFKFVCCITFINTDQQAGNNTQNPEGKNYFGKISFV